MVILVVGRSHVPALVQCTGVVLIGWEISTGTNGSLSVTNLNHGDYRIVVFAVVCEILEVTEGGSRVVKHTCGIRNLTQLRIVVVQRCSVSGELLLGSALESFRIEGIHVTKSVGPSHFISIDTGKILSAVLLRQFMASGPLFRSIGIGILGDIAVFCSIQGVGMIGDT